MALRKCQAVPEAGKCLPHEHLYLEPVGHNSDGADPSVRCRASAFATIMSIDSFPEDGPLRQARPRRLRFDRELAESEPVGPRRKLERTERAAADRFQWRCVLPAEPNPDR